jgi:hypothetical protein
MVMDDNKKRETHILQRGEYLKKGDPVSFNTPSFLPKMSDGFAKEPFGSRQVARIKRKPAHFTGTGQSHVAEIFRNRFGQDIGRLGRTK